MPTDAVTARPAVADVPRPRPDRARLRRMSTLPDYLPARMVNEYVYCPRLFYYEWVEGVFAHSSDTVEGALRHERQEGREDELPQAGDLADERIHARSVTLSSDALGLIARLDLVEGTGSDVTPVDYKRGRPRDGDEGPEAWPADRAQLCAQALVLRENGFRVREGVLYYHETRQRIRVAIDDELIGETILAIRSARDAATETVPPPPLVDSPKCPRCSLVGICLPDETREAMALEPIPDAQPWLLPEAAPDSAGRPLQEEVTEVRRLVPARDDLRPLYVTGFGLSVGKSGERLQVKEKGKLVQEVRLGDISHLNVFGAVSVSGPALQALCWSEKPVAHFSAGGWFAGLTHGLSLKNVFLRIAQFRAVDDEAFCLSVARTLVASKIRNQRTLLQRNHVEPRALVLLQMKRCARAAESAESLESLLGVEGTAARHYFSEFAGMLKVDGDEEVTAFDFAGRNRRPPRDPINALLSFGYALLAKDLTITAYAVGFDPFVGFYHQPRFGRAALALDLMEGFRPLIVDSAVLSAVNTGMVTSGDFIAAGDGTSLTPGGRKGFLRAYEARMDQLVTHPMFGYRVSYRRVLEIQARLLARTVTGEVPAYVGFETR